MYCTYIQYNTDYLSIKKKIFLKKKEKENKNIRMEYKKKKKWSEYLIFFFFNESFQYSKKEPSNIQ